MNAPGRVPVSLLLTLSGVILAVGLGSLSAAQGQTAGAPEVSAQETIPTFKLQVERNLVVIRVVVRDSKGAAVGNLRKQDFLVLDDGKLQTISHFSVESPSAKLQARQAAKQPGAEEGTPEDATAAPATPQRFMALYFDDVHMRFEEIAQTREAAERYLKASLQPADRVALFTSSGQNEVDFTSDQVRVHDALFRLRERSVVVRESAPCPDLSAYQAYLIVHEHEPYALSETTLEVLQCRFNNDERLLQQAQTDAQNSAYHVLGISETESEAALRGVDGLVARMGSLPGQRAIIVVSPGFLTETLRPEVYRIVDRALRLNVVLSGIDSRQLYAVAPGGDIDKRPVLTLRRLDLVGKKEQFAIHERSIATDALWQMASATGGTFFNNSNDLDLGFRKAGSLPETYYLLAFSPQKLKYDGRFHALKVRLAERSRLTVQARSGYFAPRQSLDAAAQEKQDIQEALFSQDEIGEIPIEVHTEFFKVNGSSAKLSVLTRLDAHALRFRKADGRNLNKLTFVTALFDRDGKVVDGREKSVEFRLLDTSMEKMLHSGIAVKTSFDVAPGTYLVREVVRETEGGQISGLNRSVEIP
jgi:VWFA-related protein